MYKKQRMEELYTLQHGLVMLIDHPIDVVLN